MPDLVGIFRQRQTLDLTLARGIEQAELDFSAWAENSAKLTPLPSQVAPRG